MATTHGAGRTLGGSGQWTSYDCGTGSNDTQVWFSIHTTTDGLHYHIDDCGTSGGYGSCTTEFGNDSVYSAPEAGTFIETWFGCEMLIMGSQGDTQAVGGTNYHIQGLANNGTGGTEWTARQWGDQGAYYLDAQGSHPSACGATDYQSTEINSGEILKFWDARNNT